MQYTKARKIDIIAHSLGVPLARYGAKGNFPCRESNPGRVGENHES